MPAAVAPAREGDSPRSWSNELLCSRRLSRPKRGPTRVRRPILAAPCTIWALRSSTLPLQLVAVVKLGFYIRTSILRRRKNSLMENYKITASGGTFEAQG